jgi:peptidoglycan glycosyltransferase
MNKALRRVAAAFLVLLGLLLVNINYLQVVKADEYTDNPLNRRSLLDEYARARGPILVGDRPIASSKETEGELKFLRVYADGPMYAPATGFHSPIFGRTGIERQENAYLAGTADEFFVRRLIDLVTNKKPEGGSVSLTLDPRAQRAAWTGMQGKRGAVVALDPRTGAILALVSSPSFDPNQLASHDPKKAGDAWQRLNAEEDDPLLNRPLAQLYPPGSTFKIITSAAALSDGRWKPDTQVDAPNVLDLPQTSHDLPNFNGEACGPGGKTSLTNALRISCNTAFAGIGLKLGGDKLLAQAEKFGFGQDLDVPMQAATSRFPVNPDPPQTALSAIGQFDVAVTPLQMAMVAAGVANGGVVMRPHLVNAIRAPDLSTVRETKPEVLSQAVSPAVAEQLQSMMVDVVENGTGQNARIPGVRVGGKTGTAQRGEGQKPDAWFVSFGSAGDRQVAVAVVIENGAANSADISGGRLAAPIAKDVMEAVLNR